MKLFVFFITLITLGKCSEKTRRKCGKLFMRVLWTQHQNKIIRCAKCYVNVKQKKHSIHRIEWFGFAVHCCIASSCTPISKRFVFFMIIYLCFHYCNISQLSIFKRFAKLSYDDLNTFLNADSNCEDSSVVCEAKGIEKLCQDQNLYSYFVKQMCRKTCGICNPCKEIQARSCDAGKRNCPLVPKNVKYWKGVEDSCYYYFNCFQMNYVSAQIFLIGCFHKLFSRERLVEGFDRVVNAHLTF